MNICEAENFNQNEESPCLIFDRCRDQRFSEFNYPIAYDETSYTRYLLLFQPSVVVVNSTGLQHADIEALINSDKKCDGAIVFVILSSEELGATQTLHQNLSTVRKLKSDCSSNNLDFSIQYAIKWGPSGYLKKGRISADPNNSEDPAGFHFVEGHPDQDSPHKGEQQKNIGQLRFSKRFRTFGLKSAALALPIALLSTIYTATPCALSLDESCANLTNSKSISLPKTEPQPAANLAQSKENPKKLVVANLDANKYTKNVTANNTSEKISSHTTDTTKTNTTNPNIINKATDKREADNGNAIVINDALTNLKSAVKEKREIPKVEKRSTVDKSNTVDVNKISKLEKEIKVAIKGDRKIKQRKSRNSLNNPSEVTENRLAISKKVRKSATSRATEASSEPSTKPLLKPLLKPLSKPSSKLTVKTESSKLPKSLNPSIEQHSKQIRKNVEPLALSKNVREPTTSTGNMAIHDLPFQSQIRIKD